MGIVVIGAVFVDIKGYPLSTYIPGGRNSGRVEQVHGGVSRNIVEDIANVELRPTFVGLVDDTGMGQDVINKLENHKVNTKYIQRVPDGMGTWLAIFDNRGDVTAAISKRPDTTPLIDLLAEQGDEIFADCDSIALELDLEKETVKQTLKYANQLYQDHRDRRSQAGLGAQRCPELPAGHLRPVPLFRQRCADLAVRPFGRLLPPSAHPDHQGQAC